MSVLRKLLAVLFSCLVALGLVAGPATAAPTDHPSRVVLRDGRGDVWKFFPKTEDSVRLHHYPRADETKASLRHGSQAVTVRIRFADLQPVGTHLFWVHLRTRDYQWDAVVTSKPGHRAGQRYFQGDDGSKRCVGFTRSIDYAGDLVTMRIPRSCLHDPAWVRLGVFNELYYRGMPPNYFDNPLNHRMEPGQTPRLYPAKA